MINLDQLQLLEAKIESAVDKISQLQVENDALRNRVQELSNALSAKSEQLSLAEQKLTDSEKSQELIESGILKALNRLNSIENSVLKSNGETVIPKTMASVEVTTEPETTVAAEVSADVSPDASLPEDSVIEENVETEVPESTDFDSPDSEIDISVNTEQVFNPFESTSYESNPFEANPFENEKSDVPGFDIF